MGWDPYWTGSGGFLSASSEDNYGKAASGRSLHITSLDGASLAFQFYGRLCVDRDLPRPSEPPMQDILSVSMARRTARLTCQSTTRSTPTKYQMEMEDHSSVTLGWMRMCTTSI